MMSCFVRAVSARRALIVLAVLAALPAWAQAPAAQPQAAVPQPVYAQWSGVYLHGGKYTTTYCQAMWFMGKWSGILRSLAAGHDALAPVQAVTLSPDGLTLTAEGIANYTPVGSALPVRCIHTYILRRGATAFSVEVTIRDALSRTSLYHAGPAPLMSGGGIWR